MTSARFHSAATCIELSGVELIPNEVMSIVRSVMRPILVGSSGGPAEGSDVTTPARAGLLVVDRVDGTLVVDGTAFPDGDQDADRTAAALVGAVDRALLAATPCLAVHAAAVSGPLGAAIIPGVSGTGKSTLAAACLQAGLDLVTDEAACLDPERDLLWPHPRPLGLDRRSRALLNLPAPPTGPPDTERATAPTLFGSVVEPGTAVPPTLLVIPERLDEDERTQVVDLTAADGLAALLANCLNIGPGRPWTAVRAWRRLSRLASTLRVVRLRYGRPGDAAGVIAELLGRASGLSS
jgi:hypothetical protein